VVHESRMLSIIYSSRVLTAVSTDPCGLMSPLQYDKDALQELQGG